MLFSKKKEEKGPESALETMKKEESA